MKRTRRRRIRRTDCTPAVECLEERTLLSGASITAPPPTQQGGSLMIEGTEQDDTVLIQVAAWDATQIHIQIFNADDQLVAESAYFADQFGPMHVQVFGGNDTVVNSTSKISIIEGGQGNDVLIGGSSIDALIGDWGNDWLFGGAGEDFLDGGYQDDFLWGGVDFEKDELEGSTGSDVFVQVLYLTVAPWGGVMPVGFEELVNDYSTYNDTIAFIPMFVPWGFSADPTAGFPNGQWIEKGVQLEITPIVTSDIPREGIGIGLQIMLLAGGPPRDAVPPARETPRTKPAGKPLPIVAEDIEGEALGGKHDRDRSAVRAVRPTPGVSLLDRLFREFGGLAG